MSFNDIVPLHDIEPNLSLQRQIDLTNYKQLKTNNNKSLLNVQLIIDDQLKKIRLCMFYIMHYYYVNFYFYFVSFIILNVFIIINISKPMVHTIKL